MDSDLAPAPLFRSAVALFNSGDFVLCYELTEQIWQTAPDPVRNFYKGFLQTAAGLAKLQQENFAGAVSLLSTGLALLEPYEPSLFGFDITALVDAGAAVLATLRRLGPGGLQTALAGPMPQVRSA